MITDQQYADLLQRVEGLEQAQADQLQPGVFSLNAAGELEEELSGKLKAKGIIFNLGHLKNATHGGVAERLTSEIIWNTEEGQPAAYVAAYSWSAKPPSLLQGINLQLGAVNPETGNEAELLLEVETGGAASAIIEILAGVRTRHLLDSLGNSDFLTNPSNAKWRFVIGEELLEWAGGTATSAVATAAPGLGAETAWIFLLQPLQNAAFAYSATILTSLPNELKIFGTAVNGALPAAGAKASVYYLGIGH